MREVREGFIQKQNGDFGRQIVGSNRNHGSEEEIKFQCFPQISVEELVHSAHTAASRAEFACNQVKIAGRVISIFSGIKKVQSKNTNGCSKQNCSRLNSSVFKNLIKTQIMPGVYFEQQKVRHRLLNRIRASA